MLANKIAVSGSSFKALLAVPHLARRNMATNAVKITDGVEFDTVAREWRMKWSPDDDKKSLAAVQQALTKVQPKIAEIPGLKSVQRVVCGGCLDYKVVVALEADKFGAWEANKFEPEESFLASVKSIPGVSTVETQTYTLMPVITK